MSRLEAILERHRRTILLVFALLALAGAADAFKMPVALFPTIDFPRIVINVEAGDRPVERMVQDITRPLEEALRAVPNVRHVRSASSRGAADISLSFEWGVDMGESLLLSQAAVTQTLSSLPPDVRFEARRMDPTVFPAVGFSLTSDARDLVALRDYATLTLRPLLSTIPGVAKVEVLGGATAEVQVAVDPMRLAAHGFATDDVVKALSNSGGVVAVGRVEDHGKLYLVVEDSSLSGVQAVQRVVVSAADALVTVGDVAAVTMGQEPQWTRVTADGRDAVLLNIIQQRGGNTIEIHRSVLATLAEHKGEIPKDIALKSYYDQGELVSASSLSVRDAILLGGLFAAIVLFLFLRDLRVTVVVALMLPGVLAASVLILDRLGMTLNIMTLGGMAAATGLIVDDAVVILEHVARRLAERTTHGSTKSAVGAGLEMARPLTYSSAATVVVFVPLAFLDGVAGGFFKALAVTIAVSLTISYAAALLAVPLFAEAALGKARHLVAAGPLLQRMQRAYSSVLTRLFRRAWLALVAVAVAAVAGFFAYRATGQGFIPALDEGGFIFDYNAPPGSSLVETDRLLRLIEAHVKELPELDSYSRRTGLQLGGGITESNSGDMFIHLKPFPRRGIEEVMSDLRQDVESDVPGVRVDTAQLMEDLIGDLTAVPQPVEVKIFGTDEDTLEAAAQEVADTIGKIPGIVEVFNGITVAGDDVELHVDRVSVAAQGMTPTDVAEQTTALVEGTVATVFPAGEKTIGVRVWGAGARSCASCLGRLPLEGTSSRMLPLRRVASIGVREGSAEIAREDLKHMIAVTARLEGRDLGSAMVDVKHAVGGLTLPAGLTVAYGGLYAEQQKSLRDLTIVFASAVVLVILLLLFVYESFAVVASILITTLLSTSGVFIGLWLTDTELNLSSMMGLTMIVGIVTEVAVFFFAELGSDLTATPERLLDAGVQRMRPILMTSAIAILALAPLAFGKGGPAGMQAPLAIAIISGLVVAVPLVLLVMPALYLLLSPKPRLEVPPAVAPSSSAAPAPAPAPAPPPAPAAPAA